MPELVIMPSAVAERRNARRSTVLWVASLSAAGRSADCVIRDISEDGALVQLLEPLRFRRRVTLIIPRFLMYESQALRCEPVWRTGRLLALRFIRP